jgi:hypothetical protein
LALSLLSGWGVQAQTVQTEALAAPMTHPAPPLLDAQTPAQRSAIVQAEQMQQAACWQKFAVNVCLSDARLTRRQALTPLRQQELALNAQERSWRNEQRERRLQGKPSETRGAP